MKKNAVFDHVLRQIASKAVRHPDYLKAESKIYYMNGNDGTAFDWRVNNHTCEFYIFYDEEKCGSQYGYIMAQVCSNGELQFFRFTDCGHTLAEKGVLHTYDKDYVESLVEYLMEEFDNNGRYDEIVYTI